MKISKIFDLIAKSSSVQMYVKQAVCYSKTNWWNVNKWKPIHRCQEKQKKPKKNQLLLSLTELWTNCHVIKIQIERTTCSNLATNARETANRAASCAFIVNLLTSRGSVEVSWVKRLKTIKMVLKIIFAWCRWN